MYLRYQDISFDTFNPGKVISGGKKQVITPTMPFLALHCAYEISLLNSRYLTSLGGFGQFGNLSNRWIKQRYGVGVISPLLPVFRM